MQNNQNREYEIGLKTLVALLVAAIVPAMLSSVVPASYESNLIGMLEVFAISSMFRFGGAFMLTVLLGLPFFLLGLRLRVIYWWSCVLVAFIIGTIPFALEKWLGNVQFGWVDVHYLRDASLAGLVGASGGLAFWVLWHYWVRYQQ